MPRRHKEESTTYKNHSMNIRMRIRQDTTQYIPEDHNQADLLKKTITCPKISNL